MFDIAISVSGAMVSPVIEGGKGIGISDGLTAGSFAAAGAVGTFSGVNCKLIGDDGDYIPLIYKTKTRLARHDELIEYSIQSAISQAKRARDISGGRGRIHMNLLWEAGGILRVINGVLSKTKGLIHGITCGAGMPYRLAELASSYGVYYYPIVSSVRAFRALWRRSYEKFRDFLGAVVYEDPWVAGGHNGLSNREDPDTPEDPFSRVADIRSFMNQVGLNKVPVIMAGGVWHLKDWEEWFLSDKIAPVGFQFGTRPLLTKESPISDAWKQKLLTLTKDDVALNLYSPTGFYSSAVRNNFLDELKARSSRQVPYSSVLEGEFQEEFLLPPRNRKVYLKREDKTQVEGWQSQGQGYPMKTPDATLIFVAEAKAKEIHADQVACMGCLSHCKFSNWKDSEDYTTGLKADPRSFCIQKTLQDVVWVGDVENNLVFAGHNAYKFAQDPFYKENPMPSVKQLVDRILIGG